MKTLMHKHTHTTYKQNETVMKTLMLKLINKMRLI